MPALSPPALSRGRSVPCHRALATLTPHRRRPFLAELIGKPVAIKLKWGMEYKGAFAALRSAAQVARCRATFLTFPPPPILPLRSQASSFRRTAT